MNSVLRLQRIERRALQNIEFGVERRLPRGKLNTETIVEACSRKHRIARARGRSRVFTRRDRSNCGDARTEPRFRAFEDRLREFKPVCAARACHVIKT